MRKRVTSGKTRLQLKLVWEREGAKVARPPGVEHERCRTIAITTFGDRVSPRLDCAESALLVKLEDGSIVGYENVCLVQSNPLQKIDLLVRLGIDVLICGGLTEACARKLKTTDILLMPWAQGEVDEVLMEFLERQRCEESGEAVRAPRGK